MRTLLLPLLLAPALAAAQSPPVLEGDAPRPPARPLRMPANSRAPIAQPGSPPMPQPPPRAAPPSVPQIPGMNLPIPPSMAGGAAGGPLTPPPGAPGPRPEPPTNVVKGGKAAVEPIRAETKCVPLQGRFMLTFNKADVVDILEQASRWTCRNFVYTEEIARGKITLLSKTPVTSDEAYAAFLVALHTNNITIYATGKYYKLVRTADAKKTPIPLYTDTETGTPANEQPITKVIRLSFSDADQMRTIVSNFVSPQGADVVSIPPDMLIITDIGLNIRRIERILEAVDRQGASDVVRLVQIRYATAKDIAEKVNQIFQAQGRGSAKRAGGRGPTVAPAAPAAAAPPPVPGAAPGSAAEVSVSKIIPDERTNKLIIIADERSFQRIQELIDQLDVPTSAGGGIHVVFLRYANAEELAGTLSGLASGSKKPTSSAPGGAAAPGAPAGGAMTVQAASALARAQSHAGAPAAAPAAAAGAPAGAETAELFSGDVKITADKTQNALLIQGSGADFQAVSRLIQTLDRPRRQVFVEAVILEVNLRNELQFGVGMHTAIPYNYKGDTGVIPIASEPGRVSSLNLGSAISLGGFLTGFVGPVSSELSKLGINLPSLGVLVQALQTSSDVNVLSTPHLVATDNEESEITVGQNVPFQSGYAPSGLSNLTSSSTSSTTSSTLGSILGLGGISSLYAPIQRQPVELRLKIKPQINEGGSVRIRIEEQTEEIASNDATLGPTTAKRTVKTQVTARDQSTVVIGGLIQERTVRSIKKVPFLGSLPILGWLFRDTDNTKTKTNLLLFLTPYIIQDESDYRRLYEKKRKEQQEFIEQFYGRQPAYEVQVDFTRKAGPFAKLHAGVIEETSRLENGGRGVPGQRFIAPPASPAPAPGPAQPPASGLPPPAFPATGPAGAAPPVRAPTTTRPGARAPPPPPGTDLSLQDEGTAVDRLEIAPEPAPTPEPPPDQTAPADPAEGQPPPAN